MPISTQPLVLSYSASKGRLQATDKVNAVNLDAALATITAKLNEIIEVVNQTIRDDNQLQDGCLEPRHMSDEFRAEVVSIVNDRVDA